MSLMDGISGLKGMAEVQSAATELRARDKKPVQESLPTGGKNTEDAATLSTASGLLKNALETSDVRSEKVDALRQSISEGTYSVPSVEVAGKIVDSLIS